MADTVSSEFIAKFHALSGITLQERNKNLSQLMKETQHSLQLVGGKIDLSTLHPTTRLEEHFKVKALLRFKCVHDLLGILQSENTALIDQVLKYSKCFLKDAFAGQTPEYLTTEVFPNMSYRTKVKVLNKLSYELDDYVICDKYFEAIKETYGLYFAFKLLPACSIELIMKSIESSNAEVTDNQLLRIFQKYPGRIDWILEKIDQQYSHTPVGKKYRQVFKYIAKNDVSLFLKLYDKYTPEIRLGTKETDVFLKNCIKLNHLKNVKSWTVLKRRQIAKSLESHHFETFFYEVFPKCINSVTDEFETIIQLLEGFPNNSAKFQMLAKTFRRIYGNEIWDYSVFRISKLIEWMNTDDREVFLQNYSRPDNIFEETWFSLHETVKSVPLLKERIRLLSNIKIRASCIEALLNTCRVNKDDSALLDVLKYINEKHRNDNVIVLQAVLSILNNSFNAKSFTAEHWAEINICIKYFMLNNSTHYVCYDLLNKYIHYRLSHGLSVTDIIKQWFKDFPYNYSICETDPKFYKICMQELENIITWGNNDEACFRYLFSVSCYNSTHSKSKVMLNINDNYVDCIKSALDNISYSYIGEKLACDLIVQDCERSVKTGILEQLLSSKYYYDHHVKIIYWLIKSNPEVLLKYLNLIVVADGSRKHFKRFFQEFCTMYTHLNIPNTIIKFCCDEITKEDNDCNFRNLVLPLSVLTTPEEFLSMISQYYPSELSPDIKNVKNQTLYKKQRAIVEALGNVVPLSQILDVILKFCKGDFLKFALKALVLSCHHTAENKLQPLFDILKERAVSVRKHAVFLLPQVLCTRNAYDVLLKFLQNEKNASILKIVLRTAFSMFLQNPTDLFWKFIVQCVERIDFSTDKEACDLISNYCGIPSCYFGKYMKFTWDTIDKSNAAVSIKDSGKNDLLNIVTVAVIQVLPSEFCIEIIEDNLFKCEKQLPTFQNTLQTFACNYLIYGGDDEQVRLKYIFDLFKNFQIQKSNDIVVMAVKHKLMFNFIQQLCRSVIDKKCTNRMIFKQFLNMWNETIPLHEACDEFIYLQLTYIYLITVENKLNIVQIGEKLASLCDSLYNQNCLVINTFTNLLSEFLQNVYALDFIGLSDENEIVLIDSIVNNRNSFGCLEVALSLVPIDNIISPVVKQKYDSIISVISKESNTILQVAFHNYLKNKVGTQMTNDDCFSL